jgi:Immunoglobulin-like domain of bacterial spore germination.
MKKFLYLIVLVAVSVLISRFFNDSIIYVTTPKKNAGVSSPIELVGKARGPWYFEASAPVKLLDKDGNLLAQSYVTAEGEWMTEEFVDFKGVLSYESDYKGEASLLFMNDNPSGDPSRDKSFIVPVVLK